MKKILMIICCIALLPTMAKASCYQIKNSDDKNYCLAKLKGQRTYCYQIKASDKKNECLTFINN